MTSIELSAQITKARAAVDRFRDFARQHGMGHKERDPLVWEIHRALDSFEQFVLALDACRSCHGTGMQGGSAPFFCPDCHGTGKQRS